MPVYKDDKQWRYRKRIELPDGTRTRIKGTPAVNTKVAAEATERAHINRVQNPPPPKPEPKEVPTLREYSKRWLLHYAKGKPSDRDSKNQILKAYIFGPLGGMQLDQVTQEHVDQLVLTLLPGRSRKTINNILGVVSSLVKYAVRNRVMTDPALLCHLEVEDSELVAVSMDDVNSLLESSDVRYQAAILLAAEAGLRVGEVRGLHWEDINEVRRQLAVIRSVDTKGRVVAPKHWRGRKVPISPRLWSALASLPRHPGPVFTRLDRKPISYWGARDGLLSVYQRANVAVPPQPWHSMRHTFGTELASAGVPVTTIKELMGHRSIQTTLRYVHVDDEARAGAIMEAFGTPKNEVGPSWAREQTEKRKPALTT